MNSPITVSKGTDRHLAASLAARPLGPLPPIPDRLRGHVLELRSVVAFWIAVDRSHGSPVTIDRARYLQELEIAACALTTNRQARADRIEWATAYAAALHEPTLRPQPGTCPRCDHVQWVTLNPGTPAPASIALVPPVGPPAPGKASAEESERLPRVRDLLARSVAQAAAHGSTDELERAMRILSTLEGRLVRDHLRLTLRLLPEWTERERLWATHPSALHQDCTPCFHQRVTRVAL